MNHNGMLIPLLLLHRYLLKVLASPTEGAVAQENVIALTDKDLIIEFHFAEHTHHVVVIELNLAPS